MPGIHLHDAAGPEGLRIYAIGDVHGCMAQLARMHAHIADEIARDRPADWRVIHLGDYVDRGPASKDVLDFLIEARSRDERHLALAGNHDVGFLDFLAEPDPAGLFARYGGVETAASYGVPLDLASAPGFRDSHRSLAEAMPASHVTFMQSLGFSLTLGDFFFCHAGVRPGVALAQQDPQDLIWIRGEFLNHPGAFEKVVVHGHTPAIEPEVRSNRVNVDTGAFRTGVLTALVIEGAEKRLLSVDGSSVAQRAITP